MLKKSFLIFLLILTLVFMSCAVAETTDSVPEPTPEPQKIQLSVNGYELLFDDIMQESIRFQLPQDELSLEENAVAFSIMVDETEYPLLTMYINSDAGDTHTVIWSETGDILPVSFVFSPVPQELDGQAQQLFELDAHEAANMLIATLQLQQMPSGHSQSMQDETTGIQLADYHLAFAMQSKARLQIMVDGNQAQFLLSLADGSQIPVFDLVCNSAEGSIVAMAADETGASIPVAFTMLPMPESLSENEALLFYQAQETVNDVLATIQLK